MSSSVSSRSRNAAAQRITWKHEKANAHSGTSEGPLRVHAILWNSLGRGSVAYTVDEILGNLPAGRVDQSLWCLSGDPGDPRDYHRPALPRPVFSVLCKLNASLGTHVALARAFALRSIVRADIVYAWPPYDLELINRARDRGAIVVAERINCMGGMVRSVLSRAFARRHLGLPDGWCTLESIAEEREQMLQCNYLTAPNALVAQSIVEAGIAEDRILQTSYGYNPLRLAKAIGIRRPVRPPVFAFVGLGIVRKGLDVLLEAWEQANAGGRLLIAGNIDDDLRQDYAEVLAREDIQELGYVTDVADVYAAADVFVFPTHEEGGPQVTYEAAACGLPCIVSPMGAGRVIRHEQEGLIINPLEVSDVADAITRLATDARLRAELGQGAAVRATEFTWDKVAARIYELFRGVARKAALG